MGEEKIVLQEKYFRKHQTEKNQSFELRADATILQFNDLTFKSIGNMYLYVCYKIFNVL